ncbi:MAG: WYL domain-containing protein [Paludibacteraceae bacterium]|nr:WYL domain-containing protein [Paludibacteraceae bacterium]
MAAQNKLFQRLIWLVDTVYSAGHISREEIDRRWSNSSYNDMHESQYGERNFHRHRETISELFGIDIVCNHYTKQYSIASLGAAESKGVRSWLVNTFAIQNMVNLAGDMKDRIIFEYIPEGSRYLSAIVSAMKENRKLQVTYQRFDRPEPHTFLLAPYCLKVFKQRWYMIGKPDDHPEERTPRVYALDRVKEITPSTEQFRLPKTFDAEHFFDNYFGVDRRQSEVQQVRIKTDANTADFIRTLPLHSSQVEVERTEDHSIFSYHIVTTYDFIQELRSHGSYLEVLEPAHLRELFHQDSLLLADLYEKK